jgi:chorismate dehydratase
MTSPIDNRTPLRIGSVSFLNARPLIHGLEDCPDAQLMLDVPAKLLDGLRDGRFDVALLPAIDYQRMEGLCIVPSGGIGCDGPTLTVRIFSRTPISRISSLACDPDSHSSVALARIVLERGHGVRPEFVDLPAHRRDCDAILLIGDKVICEQPDGYRHQIDLGEQWKRLTGLPFVFAVWMSRRGLDLGDWPRRLERCLRNGLGDLEGIVRRHAVPRGWPADIARRYLRDYLRFEIGPAQLQAIALFHELALAHGLTAPPLRPLALYRPE